MLYKVLNLVKGCLRSIPKSFSKIFPPLWVKAARFPDNELMVDSDFLADALSNGDIPKKGHIDYLVSAEKKAVRSSARTRRL